MTQGTTGRWNWTSKAPLPAEHCAWIQLRREGLIPPELYGREVFTALKNCKRRAAEGELLSIAILERVTVRAVKIRLQGN